MSEAVDELRRLLDGQPKSVCAALTPFTVVDARYDVGFVQLEFAPQPAFGNHFGNIQSGFAVAMLDTVVSIAAYAMLRQWLPTVEIKSSFWSQFQSAPASAKVECSKPAAVLRSSRGDS